MLELVPRYGRLLNYGAWGPYMSSWCAATIVRTSTSIISLDILFERNVRPDNVLYMFSTTSSYASSLFGKRCTLLWKKRNDSRRRKSQLTNCRFFSRSPAIEPPPNLRWGHQGDISIPSAHVQLALIGARSGFLFLPVSTVVGAGFTRLLHIFDLLP